MVVYTPMKEVYHKNVSFLDETILGQMNLS